ncbi:MAG: GNAT family N-acetyltransferase [Vicinamibacterales bacterium]
MVTIREAGVEDASALAALAARLFEETFGASNAPADMAVYLAGAFGEAQQRRELEAAHVHTLLVLVAGEPIGYAQVRHAEVPACVIAPSPVELWRFYLDARWHGRGVAQALMRQVEQVVRGMGGAAIWLGVWEHNQRALAFYRRLGFIDVGSHGFQLGLDLQTDRIMSRTLDGATPEPGQRGT